MRFEKILPSDSRRRKVAKKIYKKIFAKYNTEEGKYQKWIKENEPSKQQLNRQRKEKFKLL